MIIPIRCFTCGKPISDKWQAFIDIVNNDKSNNNEMVDNKLNIKYIDLDKPSKSVEGEALDKLELNRYCCRRMILTNVQLTSII